MPELTEGKHAGCFLVQDAPGTYSREEIIVVQGQKLNAGAVLGKITAGGKFRAVQPGGADGSEAAAGILWDNVDATDADQKAAVVQDGPVEVNGAELEWPAGITDPQKAAAIAELLARGIKLR